MTGLRKSAEAIARTGTHPALTAERLFATERVAAGLDALRVTPFEPWELLVARAMPELATLTDGELRRLIDGIWHRPGPGRAAAPIVGEALTRNRRNCDRALIDAYLRHWPKDHPTFRILRESAGFAAGRHDWPWRERGQRWRLWESDGPDALRAAIADGGDAGALLAEAGLAGALGDGAFAAAVRAP
jgi:hypothetical protein